MADATTPTLLPATTLGEALALLSHHEGARPFAGGTDVMVQALSGKAPAQVFVDLSRIGELSGIEVADDAVLIGATTPFTTIRRHPVILAELGMLATSSRWTGGYAIQNRGTLGGNLANASPAADASPPLLAYGASVEIASLEGRRWEDYATFHRGYRVTALGPGEVLTRVRVPRPRGPCVELFEKVGPRRAQAISKVSFAGLVAFDGPRVERARLAFGGVAPTVVRARAAEIEIERGTSLDRVLAALDEVVAPIDDVRSTARYRRAVAKNLLAELCKRLPRGAP